LIKNGWEVWCWGCRPKSQIRSEISTKMQRILDNCVKFVAFITYKIIVIVTYKRVFQQTYFRIRQQKKCQYIWFMKKLQIKIKICGMKYPQNILEIANLLPDFMGFIFYEKSKRQINQETFSVDVGEVKKIGVFVNESNSIIIEKIKAYNLGGVQLHGNETPEFCNQLKQETLVLKAFQIDEHFNFDLVENYQTSVDYFLFDTKTNDDRRGGTGKKFNWKLLQNYKLQVPFFLSGGISVDDIEAINSFSHPQFYGIDINSGFEETTAVKNVKKITTFIDQLRK
jgi:phosphoribosylanthranilate isomerase